MSHLSKTEAIQKLIQGYTIARMGRSGNRLRDPQSNPVAKITNKTFNDVCTEKLLKRNKDGLYEINIDTVMELSDENWMKQEYIKTLKPRRSKLKKSYA